MICKKSAAHNFIDLPKNCYMCSTSQTTVDGQFSNLYGFTENVVRSATVAIGFRADEDGVMYNGQFENSVAGYGFSPRDVNQNLFKRPNGEL